jgi:hypothetical protein
MSVNNSNHRAPKDRSGADASVKQESTINNCSRSAGLSTRELLFYMVEQIVDQNKMLFQNGWQSLDRLSPAKISKQVGV